MGKLLGKAVNLLAAMAALLTISITAFDWWNNFESPADSVKPNPLVQFVSPHTSITPFAAPTLEPPTAQMLTSANSVKSRNERDRALRIVAESAVQVGNYEIAIRAGASSPIIEGRAKTLVFVARSATAAGLYDLADKAASEITLASVHDSMKIEILNARSIALTGAVPSIGNSGSAPIEPTPKR